jgi:radical SAM protein with 4Fe4S-binding SPASM domain
MSMSAAADTSASPARALALGLGLTNECNLACAFCYRDTSRIDRLTLDQVRAVMERVPVRSVNLGTGENGLHPEFLPILSYLRTQPVKLTMTTNGYSVASLRDRDLTAFKDIEFSLDYPTEAEQDNQRGAGNWRLLQEQAHRCRRLGVPVTFIAVMMQSNFDRLADIAAIARGYDAPLRVNVYQSVRTDAFALSYEQYWSGFEALFAATDVIAIGEPLVRAMAGLPPRSGGCGVATVRVTPRARVQPCVYWPGGGAPLDILLEGGADVMATRSFVDARSVPEACAACPHLAQCGGGCAGRRRLVDALGKPDPYCPIVRGERRHLAIRQAAAREMPKLESACTTIVITRE